MPKEVELPAIRGSLSFKQASILTLGGFLGLAAGAVSVEIDRMELDQALEAKHPSPVSTSELARTNSTVNGFSPSDLGRYLLVGVAASGALVGMARIAAEDQEHIIIG